MEGFYSPSPRHNNSSQALAIAGLILGILAAIISFIPCLGLLSIIPAVVGIIVSAIGITQANKTHSSRGLAIAGLVCSILACFVAGGQFYFLKKATTHMQQTYEQYDPQQPVFDSLGRRIMTLEVVSDSLQKTSDSLKNEE